MAMDKIDQEYLNEVAKAGVSGETSDSSLPNVTIKDDGTTLQEILVSSL